MGFRRPDRPPDVTSAAFLLIALGGLGIFAYTVILANLIRLDDPGVAQVAASIAIALISALEVVAGVMILRLSNRWRTIGLVIAAVGAAVAILNLFAGAPTFGSVLGIAANVFVVVTLVRLRDAFA